MASSDQVEARVQYPRLGAGKYKVEVIAVPSLPARIAVDSDCIVLSCASVADCAATQRVRPGRRDRHARGVVVSSEDRVRATTERYDIGDGELMLIVQFTHGRLSDQQFESKLADLRWPADDARVLVSTLRGLIPTGRRRPPGYRGPHYAD